MEDKDAEDGGQAARGVHLQEEQFRGMNRRDQRALGGG
jgi:hypothetical protein